MNDGTDGNVDDPPPNGDEEHYPVVTDADSKRDLIINDEKPPTDVDEDETFPDTTYAEQESDENDETVEDAPPDGVQYPAATHKDLKRTLLPFDGNRKIRNKRGAVSSSKYLWKTTTEANGKRIVKITYKYVSSPPTNVKKWMKYLTCQLEQDTCIRLQEADGGHVQVVTNNNDGCFSDIGYRDKTQTLNLGTGCEYMSTVSHELMHLLGYYHEFTRNDRDNYIKVYPENLQDGIFKTEFKKRIQNNQGFPYDLNSIMQYDTHTFSKNGKHTMEAKTNPNHKLGSTSHFDAMDLEKINALYCNEKKVFKDHKFRLITGSGWGSGTDADLYVQLIGSQGASQRRLLTSGGWIQDEKERGADEVYYLPFEDVGTVLKVNVRLKNEDEGCSIDAGKRKKKRLFSFSGYTMGNLEVDGISFGGNIDLYPGDEKSLDRQK
ncbi:zinc metalloproteinase nas-1-like isoform X4 [Stylophora pistillata]|nr:zinc metalloproteinase nas-1-like isoform X4 [Stylophora pistillata]